MKRMSSLLLLALALTFGLAWADKHGGDAGEAPAVTDETTDKGDTGADRSDATSTDLSVEAEEAGVGAADTDGDLVVSHEEADAAFEALAAEAEAAQAMQPNETAEFLASREDMSLFLMLLDQADLTETLTGGDRPITIFAPSDSAFADLDRLQFSMLIDEPDRLRQALERHIVTERVSLADLNDRLSAEGSVAGGGAGDMEVAAAPESEAAGDDTAAGDEAADADTTDADVAAAAEAARLDPNAFVRISTRAGEDLEVGRVSAADRTATTSLATDDTATEVAGGGAADDPAADGEGAADETVRPVPGVLWVGDAKITESDLSAGDATIHVVDAVLLPPMPEEEEAAQ